MISYRVYAALHEEAKEGWIPAASVNSVIAVNIGARPSLRNTCFS
jgi:hypothetical protein